MANILTTPKNTSRKPYIYKVTNFETGQYYIGSQCSGKTIGVNYFTSSHNKEFREDFKAHKEKKYKITIVKAFGDPKKCVEIENLMIMNSIQLKDGLCLNRSYCCNGKKVFSAIGIHRPSPNKGIPRSEETKLKISAANKGRHFSEEAKQKMSLAKKNRIKISIEGLVFNSITEASEHYNVSFPTIRYWVKTRKHNAVYVEK